MARTELRPRLRMIAFRLTLLLAMGEMLRVGWLLHRAEEWDTPPPGWIFLLCGIPLLISLLLVAKVSTEKRVSVGAGTAFGTALTFSVLWPLLFLAAVFSVQLGGRVRHLAAFARALPYALVVSVCVLIFAFLNRRQARLFWAASGVGVAYCLFAIFLGIRISIPGSGAEKKRISDVEQPPGFAGAQALTSLTACLIRHQTLHPQEEFPQSLAKMDTSWGCDRQFTKPAGIEHYWTSYWPVKDAGSGKYTDFRIQAISADSLYDSVLMSDKRGMILQYEKGAPNSMHFAPHVYGSDLPTLAYGVQVFMRSNGEVPPQSIEEALRADTKLNEMIRSTIEPDSHDANLLHQTADAGNAFVYQYFPPTRENPAQFSLSATCAKYGTFCLRSYYMDLGSDIHATGEPRPATDQDPLIPQCERSSDSCDDPIWTPSDQPAEWQRAKADYLYLFYTTKWW